MWFRSIYNSIWILFSISVLIQLRRRSDVATFRYVANYVHKKTVLHLTMLTCESNETNLGLLLCNYNFLFKRSVEKSCSLCPMIDSTTKAAHFVHVDFRFLCWKSVSWHLSCSNIINFFIYFRCINCMQRKIYVCI